MNLDFGEIYEKYYSKIYNYVYYRLLNKENAEDAVGDVFFKALNSIDRFDGKEASVSTWLFTIAANTVNSYFRKNKKFTFAPIEEAESEAFEDFRALDDIIDQENMRNLYRCLQTLDDRARTVVALRYWGELSYAKIAEQTGLTEKNVSVILSRTLTKLKKIFAEQEVLMKF